MSAHKRAPLTHGPATRHTWNPLDAADAAIADRRLTGASPFLCAEPAAPAAAAAVNEAAAKALDAKPATRADAVSAASTAELSHLLLRRRRAFFPRRLCGEDSLV
jgi:hypothetical protein